MTMHEPDDLDVSTRDWIERRRKAARRRIFERSIPEVFVAAELELLTPTQKPSLIEEWLGSPALTLFLVGGRGAGKTFASYAALRAAADAGEEVFGASTADVLDALADDRGPRLARVAVEADVLLLDDLDRWEGEVSAASRLADLLAVRTAAGDRQIITTAKTPMQLLDLWGEAVIGPLLTSSWALDLARDLPPAA